MFLGLATYRGWMTVSDSHPHPVPLHPPPHIPADPKETLLQVNHLNIQAINWRHCNRGPEKAQGKKKNRPCPLHHTPLLKF